MKRSRGRCLRAYPLFAFFALLFGGAASSATIEDLPCQNGCANDCIRFNQGTVYVESDGRAKLLHQGIIYKLSHVSTHFLKRQQNDAEVSGDVRVSKWSSDRIGVEVTQTVLATSCYRQESGGRYVATDSCCGTRYKVRLKLVTPQGEDVLNAVFESGC